MSSGERVLWSQVVGGGEVRLIEAAPGMFRFEIEDPDAGPGADCGRGCHAKGQLDATVGFVEAQALLDALGAELRKARAFDDATGVR